MKFNFSLYNYGKTFQLTAEKVEETATLEKWRVFNQMSPGACIILQNNRPFLHSRRLFTKRWEWKVAEGKVTYQSLVDQAQTQIEYHVNDLARIAIQTKKKS